VDVKVTVYPEEGNFPEIARSLLDAADNPSQVAYVSHPRAGFVVPEEVFNRFEAARGDGSSNTRQEDSPAETKPAKRKPGRPRKNPVPSEEE
jgi:hypothetical protein